MYRSKKIINLFVLTAFVFSSIMPRHAYSGEWVIDFKKNPPQSRMTSWWKKHNGPHIFIIYIARVVRAVEQKIELIAGPHRHEPPQNLVGVPAEALQLAAREEKTGVYGDFHKNG